jgi:short-subunit dehydrogenase
MAQLKYVLLGGSGGIGSQLCRLLAGPNTQLVVGSRSEAKLKELASAVPGIETFALDACDPKQVSPNNNNNNR